MSQTVSLPEGRHNARMLRWVYKVTIQTADGDGPQTELELRWRQAGWDSAVKKVCCTSFCVDFLTTKHILRKYVTLVLMKCVPLVWKQTIWNMIPDFELVIHGNLHRLVLGIFPFFRMSKWRFPKMGVPLVLIHFGGISPIINHPAIGDL